MKLNSKQIQFLQLLIEDTKLSEVEWRSLFGSDLQDLRDDLVLRRIATEKKVQRQRRKFLVDDYKLEETVKLIPLALNTLMTIMKEGKEHNALSAAQTIARIPASVLERYGLNHANNETETEESKTSITLNYNLDDYKPDAN